MSANREMSGNTGRAKRADDLFEIRCHILEDQRKPDDIGEPPARYGDQGSSIGAKALDAYLMASQANAARQIAQAKVILALKSDEQHTNRTHRHFVFAFSCASSAVRAVLPRLIFTLTDFTACFN